MGLEVRKVAVGGKTRDRSQDRGRDRGWRMGEGVVRGPRIRTEMERGGACRPGGGWAGAGGHNSREGGFARFSSVTLRMWWKAKS